MLLTWATDRLSEIDLLLERLPQDETGGFRLGGIWGNPKLRTWRSVQDELLRIAQAAVSVGRAEPSPDERVRGDARRGTSTHR